MRNETLRFAKLWLAEFFLFDVRGRAPLEVPERGSRVREGAHALAGETGCLSGRCFVAVEVWKYVVVFCCVGLRGGGGVVCGKQNIY